MAKTATTIPQLPYSWTFNTWPAEVWPHSGSRARHLVKQHSGELRAAGALTRPTKEMVILGVGYGKWLASRANRVVEFEVAANRPEHAHKRFGQAGLVGAAAAGHDTDRAA
jgi:hypothetical protein